MLRLPDDNHIISMMSIGFGVGCLMMGIPALAIKTAQLDLLVGFFLTLGVLFLSAPAILSRRGKKKHEHANHEHANHEHSSND